MKFSFQKVVLLLLLLAKSACAVDLSVMVVYNNEFLKVNNPALFIQNQINYANQVSINSGMSTRYKLVHHQVLEVAGNREVSYFFRDSLVSSPELLSLRNKYRPDLVVYYTRSSSKLCGVALFPDYPSEETITAENIVYSYREMAAKAISVVGWDCSDDIFAHEIGHNLGGGHGPVKEDHEFFGGLISNTVRYHSGHPVGFSSGHGVKDVFRTVMTYPDVFGSAPKLALHSNPLLNFNGLPTGTGNRNNAKWMDVIATKLVQFYSSCYPATLEENPDNSFRKLVKCGGICTKYVRGDDNYPVCVAYLP